MAAAARGRRHSSWCSGGAGRPCSLLPRFGAAAGPAPSSFLDSGRRRPEPLSGSVSLAYPYRIRDTWSPGRIGVMEEVTNNVYAHAPRIGIIIHSLVSNYRLFSAFNF